MVDEMHRIGKKNNLKDLIAPVRPNLKSTYPLTLIDNYIDWKNENGLPFDPWLRVHASLGARIIKVCHEAMLIKGNIADWEKWTKMHFPESGKYIVPGALLPVDIDCQGNIGIYVEPNVWMIHG